MLPNVTEKMLHPDLRTVPQTIWKFILEKITVSLRHEDTAKRLLEEVRALSRKFVPRSTLRGSFQEERKDLTSPEKVSSLPKITETLDEAPRELTGNDLERSLVFQDLRDPAKVREDAPPLRIPTKEEKKLLKQLEMLALARKKKLEAPDSTSSVEQNNGEAHSISGANPLLEVWD